MRVGKLNAGERGSAHERGGRGGQEWRLEAGGWRVALQVFPSDTKAPQIFSRIKTRKGAMSRQKDESKRDYDCKHQSSVNSKQEASVRWRCWEKDGRK